jgi:hypothetical protein
MAIHPDEFIVNAIDFHEAAVCETVKIVCSRRKNPSKTVDEYPATLKRQGLTQTVATLRDFEALLGTVEFGLKHLLRRLSIDCLVIPRDIRDWGHAFRGAMVRPIIVCQSSS